MRKLLIGIILLIVTFFIFILSPLGLKIGLYAVKSLLPGQLHYQSANGLITGPIEIKDIHYQTQNQEIQIQYLKFNWNFWALFIKKIHIYDLKIRNIQIFHRENSTKKEIKIDLKSFFQKNPFRTYTDKVNENAQGFKQFLQDFHLNWSIQIENGFIGPLTYYSNRQRMLEFHHIQLNGIIRSKNSNFSILAFSLFPYAAQWETKIMGSSEHYRLNFSANGKNMDFNIQGQGNSHSLRLTTKKTKVFKGLLQGDISLDWKKDLIWNSNVVIKNVDFSDFYPTWSHNVELNLKSLGNLSSENPAFSLYAKMKTPKANIDLHLLHQNAWDVHWTLSLGKGQYQSEGTLKGPFENPLTTGWIKTRNLSYSNLSANSLNLKWKLPMQTAFSPNTPIDIQILGEQFNLGNFFAQKASLQFTGSLAQHTLDFSADFPGSSTQLRLKGVLQNNIWTTNLIHWQWGRFRFPSCDSLKFQIHLPDYQKGWPKLTDKIDAQLQANLSNLAFISDLVPDLKVDAGKIAGTLKISGTYQKPTVGGDLNFTSGKIQIPALNLTLNNADIQTEASSNIIHYRAHAISGKDLFTITGTTNFSQPQFPTDLKITGNTILLVDTPEYTLYGTPNVNAKIVGQQLTLTGDIVIPKGIIRPQDFRNITQLPTNEITFVGKPKVVGESFWQVNMNLNIIAGENLLVDSFGIHGLINGSVHLIQSPNQALLANGRIGIHKGMYRAYGQELKISHGSFMQFTNSPITNPSLNIEATRKVTATMNTQIQSAASEKILVGMNIHGPLNNPDINLFSNAGNLSQSDILSYLITGQGSGGGGYATANNTNAMGKFSYTTNILNAVKLGSASIGNTDDLISKIQSGLGFSELGFESDTTMDLLGNPLGNQTNFVVGRHISKDLYLRYARGVFGPALNQENKITLRYLFRRHWAIQLETSEFGNGSDTGGDILYTMER